NGHGAYLKLDREVIETARKKKVLNKHLEAEVPAEIYDQLIELIK
ncbi:MAG: YlxR family protein, partial [Erysipelotrichaceae bacterium]|nr:YlxR family protein [Erysipelotrichaceae bacterium]